MSNAYLNAYMLVTGGSRGIGAALCHHFSALGMTVIATGRSKRSLLDMRSKARKPENIVVCAENCATDEGRHQIAEFMHEQCAGKLQYLIHNAGVLGTVDSAEKIKLNEFRESMAVNAEAPFFLTQALLKEMVPGARVLHVSTGAAHGGFHGWSLYCITKAAMLMVYKVMSKELFEKKIYVGSFMPGTVDTAMQSDIRTTDSEENPLRDMFVSLHANMAKTDPSETAESKGKPPPTDALDSPENVAHFVSFLLSGMEPEEFVSADHDIRNSQLFSRWH